ncbi:MAG: hypothetical protein AUI14_00470 [Actinobacteria bacterium 13_2_20CM_2_71_6]|nr:MAG: hypothetical protein AUI14_00470 [Actinobacteria bacterium 13_2_20CM_2_71_6]
MTRLAAFVELAERMAPVCEQAVDPMEVAAALEADGITDAVAARRYGSPDVFGLAARLCRRHPRNPQPVPAAPGPWHTPAGRHLLRGALFALPALFYLALSGPAAGSGVGAVIAVSLLLSWAASQAMAYLGHVRRGRGDDAGGARIMRWGLVIAGLPVAGVTIAVAVVLHVPVAVTGLAVGQVAYLLGATVALVVGAERLLLLALAPGVAASAVGLVMRHEAVRVAAVCCTVTVLGTLALAVYQTRGAAKGRGPTGRELFDAVPHGVFGLLAGGLLAFVPTAGTVIPHALAAGGALVGVSAVLPLTVSMGLAEWLVYRYRAATYRALATTYRLRDFAARATAALLCTVVGYAAALAAGSAAAGLAASQLTGRALPVLPLASYLALGAALFVALLLMSYGARASAVTGCAAALLVEYALTGAQLHAGRPINVDAVQLGAAVGLFTVLLTYALVVLSRATRHR